MDAGLAAFLREQEISSFYPSLGTNCSAGGLCRGWVSCPLWAAAVAPAHPPNHYTNPNPHFFPHPTTVLHWKGDNISPSGEATKLKQPQIPCLQQAPISYPMALAVSLPFPAASEFLSSLKVCKRREFLLCTFLPEQVVLLRVRGNLPPCPCCCINLRSPSKIQQQNSWSAYTDQTLSQGSWKGASPARIIAMLEHQVLESVI